MALRLLASSSEGQFCDAGFVEFAKVRGDQAIVLRFRCRGQRQVEAGRAAELQGNVGVFRGVRSRRRKQECSRVCISSPSVSTTRELAPV